MNSACRAVLDGIGYFHKIEGNANLKTCGLCGARSLGPTCTNSLCSGYGRPLTAFTLPKPKAQIEARATWRGEHEPVAVSENERLRRVARFQKWVMWALLANIPGNLIGFLAFTQPAVLAVPMLLGSLAVTLYVLVSVFLLARYAFSPIAAAFFAALMFIPGVSLLVLWVVNQKAISVLQARGIPVGFFGADPRNIPA